MLNKFSKEIISIVALVIVSVISSLVFKEHISFIDGIMFIMLLEIGMEVKFL